MKKHPIAKGNGLAQMQKDCEKAMTACVKHINENYDVSELCACFPRRVDELLDAKGEASEALTCARHFLQHFRRNADLSCRSLLTHGAHV